MSKMAFQKELKDNLEKLLHTPGTINDLLTTAEQKTKVQRIYLAYGFLGLSALWLVYGWGAPLLANSIGFLYPAYWSIKALETNDLKDDKKWLTYWVVFAFFSVLEYFSGFLVYLIPFYWLLKCVFMVWCMLPGQNNGSEIIYNRLIKPKFEKHQGQIDKLVDDAHSMVGGLVNGIVSESKNLAAEHIKAN
jgi:receptor expression-enhancing protein 5/6